MSRGDEERVRQDYGFEARIRERGEQMNEENEGEEDRWVTVSESGNAN